MALLRQSAPIKLNLFLHIVGRRHDGYHLLESLFVFGDTGDDLRYEPTDEPFNIKITGPYANDTPADDRNLVVQAARLLVRDAKGTIHLSKNVPVASGIGGGSADAAAALKLLNRAWKLNKPDAELRELGLKLGADIPACLLDQPCHVSGIGEELIIVDDIKTVGYVVINPNLPLATASVFKAYAMSGHPYRGHLIPWPPHQLNMADLHNDLEASACALLPVINVILSALARTPACQLARMSGSGASCFGLFATAPEAGRAAQNLRATHPDWWISDGNLKIPKYFFDALQQ